MQKDNITDTNEVRAKSKKEGLKKKGGYYHLGDFKWLLSYVQEEEKGFLFFLLLCMTDSEVLNVIWVCSKM